MASREYSDTRRESRLLSEDRSLQKAVCRIAYAARKGARINLPDWKAVSIACRMSFVSRGQRAEQQVTLNPEAAEFIPNSSIPDIWQWQLPDIITYTRSCESSGQWQPGPQEDGARGISEAHWFEPNILAQERCLARPAPHLEQRQWQPRTGETDSEHIYPESEHEDPESKEEHDPKEEDDPGQWQPWCGTSGQWRTSHEEDWDCGGMAQEASGLKQNLLAQTRYPNSRVREETGAMCIATCRNTRVREGTVATGSGDRHDVQTSSNTGWDQTVREGNDSANDTGSECVDPESEHEDPESAEEHDPKEVHDRGQWQLWRESSGQRRTDHEEDGDCGGLAQETSGLKRNLLAQTSHPNTRVREDAAASGISETLGLRTASATSRGTCVREGTVATGSGERYDRQTSSNTGWGTTVRERTAAEGSGARLSAQTTSATGEGIRAKEKTALHTRRRDAIPSGWKAAANAALQAAGISAPNAAAFASMAADDFPIPTRIEAIIADVDTRARGGQEAPEDDASVREATAAEGSGTRVREGPAVAAGCGAKLESQTSSATGAVQRDASPPAQLEDRPEARPGHGGQASGGQEGAVDAQLEACGARLELPPTVRSPLRVFEEDLEDEMEEAADKNEEDLAALRARWDTVQTMGAPAAYALLPDDQRKPYEDLTLAELAAYATFLRYGMQGGHSEEVAAEAWCSLTCQEMADWLTDDPRATLAADPRRAPLLRELTDSSDRFPKEQHHPKKVRFYFPEEEDSADHSDAKSG